MNRYEAQDLFRIPSNVNLLSKNVHALRECKKYKLFNNSSLKYKTRIVKRFCGGCVGG